MKSAIPHKILLVIISLLITAGCSGKGSDPSEKSLIRVRETVVTVGDFRRIMENAGQELPDPDQSDDLALGIWQRLLNQTVEELIIKERAVDLALGISDAELDAAIENIKKDYPDDTFQEVFLENAVSFSTWREKFRDRLLLEKVIAKELYEKVEISPEDISQFYSANYQGTEKEAQGIQDDISMNEAIVQQIRRKKAESGYQDWIAGLHGQYQVQVDWELWKQMIELKLADGNPVQINQ